MIDKLAGFRGKSVHDVSEPEDEDISIPWPAGEPSGSKFNEFLYNNTPKEDAQAQDEERRQRNIKQLERDNAENLY